MKNEKRKSIDSNKLRQKAEVLLNTKSTKLGSLYSEDELLKIVHELDVHRIELELQNEELLTAKSELHINSQKYIELYDFAPMAYITLSKTGEIININFKAAQILGKERSKLINSRFAFFVSNDTKQLFNQFLGDLFESKTEKTSEISLSLNDNSLKYFSITGIVPELGENYLISLIDITESKNFNKILLENKELMSKTQRIAHLGTWELDLFTEKLKWSDEVYLILGLQAQEFDVTLKLFLEFIHPDDLDMVTAAYFNSIDKDQYGYEIEHRIIRKNSNEIRYVYEKCEHIRNSKGEIIRSLGMVQDITERKFAEAELKKNKEQFGLAMDATNDGLWDWDVITGKVYYSPGYFRILGYQPNEFKSTIEIWKELLHPDDKQRALAYNDACVNNTIESIKVEFRMKAKDNTWRWILSRGTAVQRDKNGKALRMIGTHIDITHNKQRDLALKESENKYRELVENSPDAIVIYTKGIIVFANNQCLQLIGASNKEELLNKPILQFAHPDYHDIIKERMNKITAAGIVLPLIDEKLIRLDGSVVDVEIKSISILHENKLSVQLIIRDISERIENEKARKLAYKMLEESEKRFSLFMDYLPATVFIKDSENRLVYANKNMDTTLGASKWIGLNSYEIFDKETAARILTDDNRALEMGYEKTEETYLHIDGSMHHYETQKFLISDNDNNILLGGIATDLSERKKYEIQIRESRDRYWSLIELAVDGILTGNEEGFIIDANSAICSMFGKDKAEIIGKYIGDSIFTPESIKQSPFQFDKLKNGEVVVSERKVIRPDATEILIEMRSKMMPDGNYQSICRDITIRKQMEDELMQLNNKLERRVIERTEELLKSNISINNIRENYETFFNTIDDFLFVLDDKGNILHTNSTVNNRLGYTYKELLEKSYLFVHPEEYHEDAKRIMAEMLAGITDFCLIPMKTKSGDYIYAEIKVKQGIWNDKNVIFGVGKDISKIKLSEEKFSKVFYLNPSAAGINDLNTGIYIDVNEAFCNLFGYKKEEVIGKTAIELGIMSFESREKILIKTDYSGKIKNEETELKTKNGKIIHVILSADTINLHDKKMRFTAIQDITSRKETEILAKQLFYYTTSLNKIAEIIISYDNAQD
ncbi:MAG: PAS domain S-box protein, partial [Bacteroidales bacterium]